MFICRSPRGAGMPPRELSQRILLIEVPLSESELLESALGGFFRWVVAFLSRGGFL